MNAQLIIATTSPAIIHGRKIPRALHITTISVVKKIVTNAPTSLDQPANNPSMIIMMTFNFELPASRERSALTYGVRKNNWKKDIHR